MSRNAKTGFRVYLEAGSAGNDLHPSVAIQA